MACLRIVGFLANFLLVWLVAVAETYVKYKDPNHPVEVRVKDLLNRMTMEERIGQMTQIDRSVASFDVMTKYYIGSLLSRINSPRFNGTTAQDWIKMVNAFQKAALSTRLEIPMIYAIDAVHGHSTVCNMTLFPHNIGLGAARDPDLVRWIGAATALEVRATGIHYTFAPCIAVITCP